MKLYGTSQCISRKTFWIGLNAWQSVTPIVVSDGKKWVGREKCFEMYVFTDHGLVNVKSKKSCEGTFLRFCNGYCV